MRRVRRILIALGALVTACLLAIGGLFAAWMSGMHVPIASGATYMRIEKVDADRHRPTASAARRTAPFFILLVGNDSRPGVGGARGDALHVLGVNPAQKHQATMLDIPRDTCWNGDKINVGNTIGPRAQANDVGGLLGVPISYVVDVDFAGFTATRRRRRRRQRERADADARLVLGCVLHSGHAPHERRRRRWRSRATATTSRRATSSARTTRASLILDAMRQLGQESQNAAGEFKLLALLGRHAQLDGIGIKDLYRLGSRRVLARPRTRSRTSRCRTRAASASVCGAGAPDCSPTSATTASSSRTSPRSTAPGPPVAAGGRYAVNPWTAVGSSARCARLPRRVRRANPELASRCVHREVLPATDPRVRRTGGNPAPARWSAGFARVASTALYEHQVAGIDALRDGRSVVVATGTASGKSLCYQVPIVSSVVENRRDTALLIFPTKALAQDQLRVVALVARSRTASGHLRRRHRRPTTGRGPARTRT